MTFINIAVGLSPFWKEAGYHLKTTMVLTDSGAARGNMLPLLRHRRIKPELLHVRFPLFTPWLALVY